LPLDAAGVPVCNPGDAAPAHHRSDAVKLPAFDYAAPATLAEAIGLLAAGGGMARPLAGGQTLLPIMAFRLAAPAMLVDLRKIPGLDGIEIGPGGVRLGARVRWCEIEAHAALRAAQPLIGAAIGHVAHHQIRQRGTLGGSLAHADPAAEFPALAVACDAVLVLAGPGGERRVAAGDFFVGALTTALTSDELIVAVEWPAWAPGRAWGFEEFSRRHGDFALAGVAVHYAVAAGRVADAHVAVFGACSCPHRVAAAEAVLNGAPMSAALAAEAGRAVAAAVEPPEDIHATASYRRALAGTLAERALLGAMGREG
jgi:carbon-monoxide dehydrogenase medium subunit